MQIKESNNSKKSSSLSNSEEVTTATSSNNEHLVALFLAAMEACWIAALLLGLANIDFSGSNSPLVPLWIPFVFLILSCWISQRTRANAILRMSMLLVLLILGVVSIIWVFQPSLFQALGISTLLLYLCLRGNFIALREIHPSYALKTFRLAITIIILTILVQAIFKAMGAIYHDDFVLLFLILLLVFLWLITHSLANSIYISHFAHPVSAEQKNNRNTFRERRGLSFAIVISILIVLVVFSISSILSPKLLVDAQVPLQTIYQALVHLIAAVFAFVSFPFYWLLHALRLQTPLPITRTSDERIPGNSRQPPPPSPLLPPKNQHPFHLLSTNFLAATQGLLEIFLPILLVAATIFLVIAFLRHRKQQREQVQQEKHESLWSWRRFCEQFKAFLLTLLSKFVSLFSRRKHVANDKSERIVKEDTLLPPTQKSIREIYRAFMRRAESRGFPRQQSETPFEFRVRLSEQFPAAETQLRVITQAYTTVRYGNERVDAAQEEQVIHAWTELEQLWGSR